MRQLLPKLGVPIGVVGIIMLLVVPVPPFLLDILIILNIMFALVILLTSMFVKKPLDFSVFPSLLLWRRCSAWGSTWPPPVWCSARRMRGR